MHKSRPNAELDTPFSDDDAVPTPWPTASDGWESAGIYWVSSVRPDRQPHVTPVAGLWMDDAFYFSTGADEQKGKNLARNPRCVVTTGCNAFREGLDLVIEGSVAKVVDPATLAALADRFASKYEDFFGFRAGEGVFSGDEGGGGYVFEVAPAKAFAYNRNGGFSATRYRFGG